LAQDIVELADAMWRGEGGSPALTTVSNELSEVTDGIGWVWSLANVSAFQTGAGLVLVDTGSAFMAGNIHAAVRGWTDLPLHTAIYSHGHIDHVFGVRVFEEEVGGAPARVVAHEAMPARFDRYILTNGYNSTINERQFGLPNIPWPRTYRYPDETYRDRLTLDVGGETFELHHARGETDDHTWTWVPARRVLCTGDFFIWASPNAGNPQKVQRYPNEWAAALREMADLGAEVLLPGHGVPIFGSARILEALTNAAELLEALHDQTVALMNEGASLDTILHTVKAPPHLLEKPYLQPTYDDPEFIVRNVWRLYGGWWDGDPASLKPAPQADVARELATLAGGADRLATRARVLADEGNLRLAGHLAEFAALAAKEEHATRAEINERRANEETSVMAKGIFGWAARESRKETASTTAGDKPRPTGLEEGAPE
jgi:alkyl sulfatase BDS1-like metallo-beta-lactamase superfamily hydrolase